MSTESRDPRLAELDRLIRLSPPEPACYRRNWWQRWKPLPWRERRAHYLAAAGRTETMPEVNLTPPSRTT